MSSDIKTVLVTGGAGFVGTNLVIKLKSLNYNVIVLDNLSYGKKENYIEGVVYIKDHTKNIFNIGLTKLDLIFHLGEYSKITPSYDEIETVFDLNILGSFAILEYARKNNIPIVYAASSTKLALEGENHSPYSFFKSSVVQLIKNYGEWYDLKYSICYFYNVYGPYQDTCDTGWETVISIFEKQYKANLPLTVVGDGLQRRDFTYAGDIVSGLILASEKLSNEEYQLGSGTDYSILEIAKMFSDDIKFVEPRKGDRKYSKANIQDTYNKLAWTPKFNLIKWINNIKGKAMYDVVIMATAIDRPEIHSEVFKKYREYVGNVNCKWVITINNINGNADKTEQCIRAILDGCDIDMRVYDTGGSRNDWFESVKYCINTAHDINPSTAYVWLEDDWLLTDESRLENHLQLLDNDNCYISLNGRDAVSFNPGIWSLTAFNELMYNSINNINSTYGRYGYAKYTAGDPLNPERVCCPVEANTFIKSFKRPGKCFADVGRAWQQTNSNSNRTFNIK